MMNIQGFNCASNVKPQASKKQPISFQATLPEIKQAVEEKQGKLCPGKTAFVMKVVNFMEGVQQKMKADSSPEMPKKLDFVLGEVNSLPESVKGIEVNGNTLAQLDKQLNETSFSCGPDSDCSCGKGQSLGEFFSKVVLAKILKVPNPEKIELDVKNV